MVERKINVAIDGYSGTGKSSTAKEVASRLGYTYLDSGAMYRAVTLYFLNHEVDWKNKSDVVEALRSISISFSFNVQERKFDTCLNGKNVEEEIRGMMVSNQVSKVSAITEVREKLVSIQRELGKDKGVVMDGRDIGTVVFPSAELKVFMISNTEVRARRRQKELEEKGQVVSLEEVIQNLQERDQIDTTRKASPLVKAEDAIEIDTTNLTFDEQVNEIVKLVEQTTLV